MIKKPPKRRGWFELPDMSGKAPIHKAVANKNCVVGVLRRPMVRKEHERKPDGYWTDKTILEELKKIIAEIGHFPTRKELEASGRGDLDGAISVHGGYNKFRHLLKEEIIHAPTDFWSDNTIINELKKIRSDLGHFPTTTELRAMGRSDLANAISKHGGMNKFRLLLNEKIIQVDNSFWADETIINELKKIRSDLGHFPTKAELYAMGRSDLATAIVRHGGMNKFRLLLNVKIIKVDNSFWADETIINELKKIRTDLGHFPSRLRAMGKSGLAAAISKHGGMNKFRLLLNEKIIQVDNSFWADETIINELKKIRSDLGHFPTITELYTMGKNGLAAAISKHGGIDYFRNKMGELPSLEEAAERGDYSYFNFRGINSEKIMGRLLKPWCKQKKYVLKQQKSLREGDRIDFYIETKTKTIGIDVTNTCTEKAITRKWREKKYNEDVTEFHIVVFSDAFSPDNYKRINSYSDKPSNVIVWYDIDYLDYYKIPYTEKDRTLIMKYNACEIHNVASLKAQKGIYDYGVEGNQL